MIPLGTLIRRSKIEGHRNTFVHLGKILAHRTKSTRILRDVHGVVAVPSPWTRRLRRGLVQAPPLLMVMRKDEMTKYIAPYTFDRGHDKRRCQNRPKTNIVHRQPAPERFPYPCLMDDIYTTGTTDQCAQHLKALGALKVIGLVACVSS